MTLFHSPPRLSLPTIALGLSISVVTLMLLCCRNNDVVGGGIDDYNNEPPPPPPYPSLSVYTDEFRKGFGYIYTLSGALLYASAMTHHHCFRDSQEDPEMAMIGETSVSVKTTVLFDFGQFVENSVNTFLQKATNSRSLRPRAAQASCHRQHDQATELSCMLNVWIVQFDGSSYEGNFFYKTQLDEHLRPVGNDDFSSIKNLVAIAPEKLRNLPFAGPQDPRLIFIENSTYVIFDEPYWNADTASAHSDTFLWSVDKKMKLDFDVAEFLSDNDDKNWTPLVYDGQLYLIWQFFPQMKVMKCHLPDDDNHDDEIVHCELVATEEIHSDRAKAKGYSPVTLRGGSPAVHYQDDYYITISHSYHGIDEVQYKLASQIILFNVVDFRVVFISSPLIIDPSVMKNAEIRPTSKVNQFPFLYVSGLFFERKNSLILSAGLNDERSFLIRLEGYDPLLQQAIDADRNVARNGCDEKAEALYVAGTDFDNWYGPATLEELKKIFPENPE